MATTRLYLVRHGRQEHSGDGEHSDTGLSATGRQQAHLLGARLAGQEFDILRHSPLRRAAETAQVLGEHLPGVPIEGTQLLRDRTPALVGDEATPIPPRYRAFLESVPAAERDTGAVRLREAVAELLRPRGADRTELLVTHAFVLGWFVRHALDAPAWRWIGLNPSTCGLTQVEVSAERGVRLVGYDDIGHLGGRR